MENSGIIEVISATINGDDKVELGTYRITVPPPLPSARQQQIQNLKLAKATFDDIKDLQLAAELGRTLLERNEELETELKQQQMVIDDQGQEIEFLSKQVSSMKEESANRSKIYEQLESSISELEKENNQLGHKRDVDKKKIQSLYENIEYLERKCEELNATLQSIRNEQGKKNGSGKINRSNYLCFGSDSSEEEMSSGFGLFRKRSHSLQDLRDYTPSPDEFDSGNSNSPDFKTSESEFIDSLENRIEELIESKNKETDKVRQLEAKIKILIQENANLQQQILQVNKDHEEEVSELRRFARDSSNYGSHPNIHHSANSPFSSLPFSSTRRNSESNSTLDYNSVDATNSVPCSTVNSPGLSSFSKSSSICRRCATEIRLLNLVNSIENDENVNDWEYGNPDDDMEFSSLEHELARAIGTPYRKDNRFNEDHHHSIHLPLSPFSDFQMVPSTRRNSLESAAILNNNNNIVMSNNSAGRNEGKSNNNKFKEYLCENPRQIDVDEMDYENTEMSDAFFGVDEAETEKNHSPVKVRFSDIRDMSSTSLSTASDDDEERPDEDPCLIKDRKPETESKNKPKSKNKKQRRSITDDKLILSTSIGCVKGLKDTVSAKESSFPRLLKPKNPRFMQLPKQIPADDVYEKKAAFPAVESSKDGSSKELAEAKEEGVVANMNEEKASALPSLKHEEFDEDEYDNISECSEVSESGTLSVSISNSTISIPELASSSSSPVMPEYKQILNSLFSIFNNSKRKYPIPMYPCIQEARRQSAMYQQQQSHFYQQKRRNAFPKEQDN